jgi:hypothetical protein
MIAEIPVAIAEKNEEIQIIATVIEMMSMMRNVYLLDINRVIIL